MGKCRAVYHEALNTNLPKGRQTAPPTGPTENSMRIALIMLSKGYGGLERHLVDLANTLDTEHTVAVFTDPSFSERLAPGIALIPCRANTWRYNPWALWRLKHQLNAFRPDVIHAQANKAAQMIRLCGARAPVNVATIHNVKNETKPFRHFDGVIAVSQAVAARLDHPRISVIPNGIAPPQPPAAAQIAACRAHWCSAGEPLTISVGRLVAAKGFDILLDAWRDLPGKLIIVGSGPDEAALKARHAALGLGDRVVFAGYRADVPLLMAAADLLVIASRREGFPYVLIEALHTGVPIVATAIPGAADYLPANRVVPCGVPTPLHTALAQALENRNALRALYQPAFQRARTELTLEHMARRTLDFYRCLETPRAPSAAHQET